MRYLLDSSVLIDHSRGRDGAAELVESLFSAPNDLFTCDIVVTEALTGGTRPGARGHPRSDPGPRVRVDLARCRASGPPSRAGRDGALSARGRSPTRSSPVSPGRSRPPSSPATRATSRRRACPCSPTADRTAIQPASFHAYLGRSLACRGDLVERRHRVPPPHRAAQPQAAVARVVGLLRGSASTPTPTTSSTTRSARRPRSSTSARSTSTVVTRPRRRRARRPGHHPRRDEAGGRAGLLHALVRRARQGRRRRHGPPRRRDRVPLDGRRPAATAGCAMNAAGLDVDRRGRHRSRSPRSPSRDRCRGPCSRRPTGESFADLRYFRRRPATIGKGRGASPSTSRGPATPGDLGYELWIPADKAPAVWDALMKAGARPRRSGRPACSRSTSPGSRPGSSCSRSTTRRPATRMNPEQNYSPVRDRPRAGSSSFDKARLRGPAGAAGRAGAPAARRAASSGSTLDWYDIEGLFSAQGLPPAISPTRRPLAGAGLRRRPGPGRPGRPATAGARSSSRRSPSRRCRRPTSAPGTQLEVEWTVEGRRGRVAGDGRRSCRSSTSPASASSARAPEPIRQACRDDPGRARLAGLLRGHRRAPGVAHRRGRCRRVRA